MRNLLILAKWLAGRADIDVVEYRGSTARIELVNGRRVIKLPSHWSYSTDPEAAELLEGVIDHEALGHGRFTDLEGRTKAEAAGLIKFTKLSAGIQNILEDIYIENRAIDTYPGVKMNLARTVEILVGRGFFGTPEMFAQAEGAHLLTGGLLNVLRARLVPGQSEALKENVEALEIILPDMLGQIWNDVLAIGMEVQNSTSTACNIALTVRIMKLIEGASQQKPQQPEESEQTDQQGDPADDADAGGPGDETDATKDPSSCPGDQSGEPADDDAQQGGSGQGGKPTGAQADDTHQYPAKEIKVAKDIMALQDDEMPATEIGDAISEAIQKAAQSTSADDLKSSDRRVSVSDQALRVASQVKSVSDELQDVLLTQTQCEKSTKLSGKALNNRVLSRVRLGNSRVFRHKHEGVGLSTAIGFVVDMSSSMNEHLEDKVSRLDAAIGLVYGMGDILDEFGVPFQSNMYSDSYATLKGFEEDWTQVRKRRERPHIAGGTWTGLAVQKALGDLVMRQEDRRLLMVITDGDTGDLHVLMSCYAEAQAMGIDVVSVMIGPKIRSIEVLASKFGFNATHINVSTGLGRFAIERVLEAI